MPMLRSLSSDNLLPSLSSGGGMRRNGSSNSLKKLIGTSSNHSNKKGLNRSNSSKSLGRMMDGMKQGVTGVADIGKAGAAYGFAGVSNAAELAAKTGGAMMGGRAKPSTCRRRQSEFNVLGGSIVSENFLLQNIKAAEKNNKLTKLELEDLVNGKGMADATIFEAVASLLKNDGGRPWLYIKFLDSLRIGVFGDGLKELQQYEKKRQALWEHIKTDGGSKPIMFSLKVEIEEDTPASTVIDILKELLGYNLVRVEYMGGLYGYKAPEIAEALADLCKPDDPLASIEEVGELKEMILFNLHYASGGGSSSSETTTGGKSHSPTRDRVWRKVLRRCVKRLGGQVPPGIGESEHGFGTRSRTSRSKSPARNRDRSQKTSPDSPRRKTTGGNTRSASNRSLSPPQKRVTDPSILPTRPKPMARRAISEGMNVPMPTMRRAVSMPEATPQPKSLGSSTHHHKKRRKPRAFANVNTIQELDDDNDNDDNDEELDGSHGSIGDDSFADDSSKRNSNTTETKEEEEKKIHHQATSCDKNNSKEEGENKGETKKEEEEKNDKVSSRPSRRGGELRRSVSSPMIEGGPSLELADTEKKKGIKRSTSLKRETSTSKEALPCYDWTKHSCHNAAATSA